MAVAHRTHKVQIHMGTDQPRIRSEGTSWIGFVRSRGKGYRAGRMSSGMKEPAWRYIYFWKEFQADYCKQSPWMDYPMNPLPKLGVFVLYLRNLHCPFSLQNCCTEQKVTLELVGFVDSGRVFCSESNILFSPLPKKFCHSTRWAGTNNICLVQASFDLCILAFCKTNLKMKKVEPSKS